MAGGPNHGPQRQLRGPRDRGRCDRRGEGPSRGGQRWPQWPLGIWLHPREAGFCTPKESGPSALRYVPQSLESRPRGLSSGGPAVPVPCSHVPHCPRAVCPENWAALLWLLPSLCKRVSTQWTLDTGGCRSQGGTQRALREPHPLPSAAHTQLTTGFPLAHTSSLMPCPPPQSLELHGPGRGTLSAHRVKQPSPRLPSSPCFHRTPDRRPKYRAVKLRPGARVVSAVTSTPPTGHRQSESGQLGVTESPLSPE